MPDLMLPDEWRRRTKNPQEWWSILVALLVGALCVFYASPVHAEPVRFGLEPDDTYTAAEKAKFKRVVEKIHALSVDPCFQSWFTDEKKRKRLIQTDGLTRHQVVKHIATGTSFAKISMYHSNRRVIGYRSTKKSDRGHLYTNSKYYRGHKAWREKLCPWVSNGMHELVGHGLGYGHDFNPTKRRPYSVPYTITAAVNACCTEDL